ncbi:hypothetical protein ACFQ3N_15100 [Virgibacillus byunsanensis]|uniref:DUF1292 domain-containing protein n=1 Tax=Virgibacillus byunsanensis TaxID=570945 RepID=A0ABW3LMV6_9BACI
MELKKVEGYYKYRDYILQIVTTNQVKEDHYSTESIYIDLDNGYINISEGYPGSYEVVSDTNHLQTIESLVENEEVDWDYRDD